MISMKGIAKVEREEQHCLIRKFSIISGNIQCRNQEAKIRSVYEIQLAHGTNFDLPYRYEAQTVTYVIEGILIYSASADGPQQRLGCGGVIVAHRRKDCVSTLYNGGRGTLRLLQIVFSGKKVDAMDLNHDEIFCQPVRAGSWTHLASGLYGTAPTTVSADADIFAARLLEGETLSRDIASKFSAYLLQLAGTAEVNDVQTHPYDTLEIRGPHSLRIEAVNPSHMILLQLEEADG